MKKLTKTSFLFLLLSIGCTILGIVVCLLLEYFEIGDKLPDGRLARDGIMALGIRVAIYFSIASLILLFLSIIFGFRSLKYSKLALIWLIPELPLILFVMYILIRL